MVEHLLVTLPYKVDIGKPSGAQKLLELGSRAPQKIDFHFVLEKVFFYTRSLYQ